MPSYQHRSDRQPQVDTPEWSAPDHQLLNQFQVRGQPMALPNQTEIEAELGLDLSGVQAMMGNSSAMESLQADAAATGNRIYFSSSNPSYEQQVEEVVHLVQQSRAQGQGISSPTNTSERQAKRGAMAGTGSDASLHRDESSQTATQVVNIEINPGSEYVVSASDITSGETDCIRNIARSNGMMSENLMVFNQHISSMASDPELARYGSVPALAAGVVLYIPSSDELAFHQCTQVSDDLEAAKKRYAQMGATSDLDILRSARHRASGKIGVGYGNKGLGEDIAGPFLTPNSALAGASASRSEEIGGQIEYRVNWNADEKGFWKCSVFLHDVTYDAGYQPHMSSNNHYLLAGRLHESKDMEEASVQDAAPGCLWQRFGGTGSDQSHNAILTSFVSVDSSNEDHDSWSFTILGAERPGAGESTRTHKMKKGTNENMSGKFIRFFRPKVQRTS